MADVYGTGFATGFSKKAGEGISDMADMIIERRKKKEEDEAKAREYLLKQQLGTSEPVTKAIPERPIPPPEGVADLGVKLPAVPSRAMTEQEFIENRATMGAPESQFEWQKKLHIWVNTNEKDPNYGNTINSIESPGVGYTDAGLSGTSAATNIISKQIGIKGQKDITEMKGKIAEESETQKQKGRMEILKLRNQNAQKIRSMALKDERFKNAMELAKQNFTAYDKLGSEENYNQYISSLDKAIAIQGELDPNNAITDYDSYEKYFMGIKVGDKAKPKDNENKPQPITKQINGETWYKTSTGWSTKPE